jgi:hypothetical protein
MNVLAATLALAAAVDGAPVAAAVLGLLALMFALRIVTEAASATATAVMAIDPPPPAPVPSLAPVP